MALPDAVANHYRRQQNLTAAAVMVARTTWARLNPDTLDRSWTLLAPRLLVSTAAVQRTAAADGARYVPEVLEELDITTPAAGRVAVGPLVGVASDGRPLVTLLREPLIHTKTQIGAGVDVDQAMTSGLTALEQIIITQVADAARAAASISITARRDVGYVRMLNTPSCGRCAVLAGKFFRYNQGFQRHPRCDCRHIPATEDVAGDLTTDPLTAIRTGNVTGLSRADTRAILEDGADIGQVINARRGMTALGTSEGVTRRGFAGKRLRDAGAQTERVRSGSRTITRATGRLRPQQIYDQTDSREDAIELLYRHGYLV